MKQVKKSTIYHAFICHFVTLFRYYSVSTWTSTTSVFFLIGHNACLSCWRRYWASFSLYKDYKGADENLPSIVRSSRHGKSYFVPARTRIKLKKQQVLPCASMLLNSWEDSFAFLLFDWCKGSTEDAHQPVYKEKPSFSLRESGSRSELGCITHRFCFSTRQSHVVLQMFLPGINF